MKVYYRLIIARKVYVKKSLEMCFTSIIVTKNEPKYEYRRALWRSQPGSEWIVFWLFYLL